MLLFIFYIDFGVLDMLHLGFEPAGCLSSQMIHLVQRVSPFQSSVLILCNGGLGPGHENLGDAVKDVDEK